MNKYLKIVQLYQRANVCQRLDRGDWTYMTKTNQWLCHKANLVFVIQVTAGDHGVGMDFLFLLDYLDMVSLCGRENAEG